MATTRKCSVEGCGQKHYAKELCNKHYKRLRNTGQLEDRDRSCSVEGCCNISVGHKLCLMHYTRMRRHGDPLIGAKIKTEGCSVSGCCEPHACKGFCRSHYARWKRTGSPLVRIARCSVEGCERKHCGHGLCALHLRRKKNNRAMNAPVPNTKRVTSIEEMRWKRQHQGYMVGWKDGRTHFQHRVVWEQHHGRALRPFENIHHINGIRDDNRIENLELWTKAQPCGQRPEDLVEWVINNYPDLVSKRYKKQKAA